MKEKKENLSYKVSRMEVKFSRKEKRQSLSLKHELEERDQFHNHKVARSIKLKCNNNDVNNFENHTTGNMTQLPLKKE